MTRIRSSDPSSTEECCCMHKQPLLEWESNVFLECLFMTCGPCDMCIAAKRSRATSLVPLVPLVKPCVSQVKRPSKQRRWCQHWDAQVRSVRKSASGCGTCQTGGSLVATSRHSGSSSVRFLVGLVSSGHGNSIRCSGRDSGRPLPSQAVEVEEIPTPKAFSSVFRVPEASGRWERAGDPRGSIPSTQQRDRLLDTYS